MLPSNFITPQQAAKISKASNDTLILAAIMCEINRAAKLGMQSIVAYLPYTIINILRENGYNISADRFSYLDASNGVPKYRSSIEWHHINASLTTH
jgi:hypothetical protein